MHGILLIPTDSYSVEYTVTEYLYSVTVYSTECNSNNQVQSTQLLLLSQ
nr:MAG TPA: hypothetical protein [Caudoviricetes sp.]